MYQHPLAVCLPASSPCGRQKRVDGPLEIGDVDVGNIAIIRGRQMVVRQRLGNEHGGGCCGNRYQSAGWDLNLSCPCQPLRLRNSVLVFSQLRLYA